MIPFLKERQFMYERLQLGIDIHLNDRELAEFQRLANTIYPKYEHVSRTCQSCVNALVKFVFEKQDVAVKKAIFEIPKVKNYAKKSKKPDSTGGENPGEGQA